MGEGDDFRGDYLLFMKDYTAENNDESRPSAARVALSPLV